MVPPSPPRHAPLRSTMYLSAPPRTSPTRTSSLPRSPPITVLSTSSPYLSGDESPDEKHEAALGWFHLEELEEELDDGYDYIVSELEHADANQRVQSCEGLWERIIDVTITNGGHTIKEGDGRSTADDHNGIPRLSLASTVVSLLPSHIPLRTLPSHRMQASPISRFNPR